MNNHNWRHKALWLALLFAGAGVASLASARPSNTGTSGAALEPASTGTVLAIPECTALDPSEWQNGSIDPVPLYAAPDGIDQRDWLVPGASFLPTARCGEWLEVPTGSPARSLYVRIGDVEPEVSIGLDPFEE